MQRLAGTHQLPFLQPHWREVHRVVLLLTCFCHAPLCYVRNLGYGHAVTHVAGFSHHHLLHIQPPPLIEHHLLVSVRSKWDVQPATRCNRRLSTGGQTLAGRWAQGSQQPSSAP